MIDYSQFGEQAILSDLLTETTGVYIDIGAHNGIVCSNTRFLWEKGWSGVLVEPTKRHIEITKNYPERATVFPYAVSDYVGQADFYDIDNPLDGRSAFYNFGLPSQKITVQVTSWLGLLELINVAGVKIEDVKMLSIDTEGQDFTILNQIDFSVFNPRVVVAEFGFGAFDKINNLMTTNKYTLIKQTYANLIYKK